MRGAMSSRGKTSSAWPPAMTAAGMLKMTDVSSSWTMVRPPAFLIAAIPPLPSRPMPVRTTPTPRGPNTAATDSIITSTDGRTEWTGGSWLSRARVADGRTWVEPHPLGGRTQLVVVAGGDEHQPFPQFVAVLGFPHRQRAPVVGALRVRAGEARLHVLGDDDPGGQVGRKGAQHFLQ